VVTSVLGPGHCFGEMTLFGDLPRTHDAVAMGATVIDHVSPAAYQRFAAAHPALDRAIMSMMARRLHVLLEFADDLRRLPLKVQLAKLLLSMAQAAESRADATHEELAAILGVSRVAIGTALRTLEREGLVKRRYGTVEVPDRAALRSWIAERTMLAPI
jgi:CRP-like cAMP-binding protein